MARAWHPAAMLTTVAISQIYVLDQDQALDFYVNKLGFEVRADADLGDMRWLTVGLASEPERSILLALPGPPSTDEATGAQVRDLVTKGAGGGWLILNTDDVHAVYRDLQGKGVDLTQEPVEHFYGTDIALRDPFGNPIRITQLAENPQFPAPGTA